MSSADDALSRRHNGRRVLPPMVAFIAAAITNASLYLATGAPTPILLYMEEQWRFPASLLTIAFAAYSIGLLLSILVTGSLSDHIGRRPVIIGALVIQIIVMVMFVSVQSIEWVIVARVIQGVATGAATSAFTAAVVELAPDRHKKLGVVFGSMGPPAGLGLGALIGGVAVQFTTAPTAIIFGALAIVMVIGIVFAYFSIETVSRMPGALRSLRPTASVPKRARAAFASITPLLIGAWMLPGLYMGLGPTIIRDVFHIDSGLLNGFTAFLQPGSAAIIGVILGHLPLPRLIRLGGPFLVAGAVLDVVAILVGSLPVFMLGGIAGGIGYGLSFTAIVGTLSPLAERHERAGLFAALFLVSYLSFGIPTIIAGQLLAPVGLLPTVVVYAAVIAAISLIGLILLLRRSSRSRG